MKPTQLLLSVLIASAALSGAIIVESTATAAEVDLKAARALGDAFASVAERVKPAVVSIHSSKTVKLRRFDLRVPFGEDFPLREFCNDSGPGNPFRSPPREYKYHQGGLGSGVIVDKEGHIRTNNHVVSDVEEGSPAALAGIQAGDLVTEINRVKVTHLSQYRDALTKVKDTVLVLLKIRDGGSRFVIVRVK